MSTDIVFAAIRDWMDANWTACPVFYENEADARPPDLDAWISLQVSGTLYSQISIGAGTPRDNLWRETGYVRAFVLVASGTGSLLPRQLATQLAEAWKGLEIPPTIRFQDLEIADGEPNGNYWGMPVHAAWIRN